MNGHHRTRPGQHHGGGSTGYIYVYDIRDYGAQCNGTHDDGPAINSAIAAAAAAGGGTVYIPFDTAIATQIVIGGAGNPVSGVCLAGPGKPQAGYQTSITWIGNTEHYAMLLVRNAAGGEVTNLGFNSSNKTNYCIQFRNVVGTDANVVEQWLVQCCNFVGATVANVLAGDVLANAATSTDDISLVTFEQCYFGNWQGGVSGEPATTAHILWNASNGLGNSARDCQFISSAENSKAVPIQNITNANPAVVTATAHGFVTGQNTVFQGTGTNLDFSLSNQAGYSITVIDANHFSVPAASGSSSTTGDAYHQGYPLYGVYGSLGRFDCYDCVGSVMGIADACAPGLASAVDVISGIVSLHNHESQSPNVLNVLAGSGTGTPLYPCLVDGLHHSDILGYGVYTVNWARGIYASLNVEGGFFGRAFLMNVAAYNAFVNGTQFAAADGTAVGGTDTAYITGWWVVDGTRTVQTGPANVTPFAISTVSGQARLASTGTDGIDVWALGSTINIALSDALAGTIESSSGYLQLAAASGQSGLWLDATSSGSNVLILRTGAANANGYFDVGINNFRHGNATNQFLTIRDGTPSPFSGAATDALISAVSQLQLSSGSATNIWCNGTELISTNSSASIGFFGASPVAQPSVTGSRASGAALVSLLNALSSLGLIVNNTTT